MGKIFFCKRPSSRSMLVIISRVVSSREATITKISRIEITIKTSEAIIITITSSANNNTIVMTFKKKRRSIRQNNHLKDKMERMKKRWTIRTPRHPCQWQCLSSTIWVEICVKSISPSQSSCSWTRRNPYVKSVFLSTSKRTLKNRRKVRTKMRPDRLKMLEWQGSKPWLSTLIRLSRLRSLVQLTT